MKKVLIMVFGLIFSFQISQGQINGSPSTDNNNNTHDYYFFKHKQQKKNGLVFLGVGIGSIIVGLAIALPQVISGSASTFIAGSGLVLVGSICTLVSVPILISSGNNKRKAKAFIASENIGFNAMPSFNKRYVSLGLSIGF